MVIRPSRHKPQVGDLFVLNMLGKRWIAGRVIRTDADALVPNSDLLLYFYRVEPTGPDNIATPIKPDLLIPPILSSALGWRRGYYMHIRNNPLQAQELLPRHVFEDNLFPKGDPRRFCDEYRKPVAPPEPGLPSGPFGMFGYSAVDTLLSHALGIPPKLNDAIEVGPGHTISENENSDEFQVALHIPTVQEGKELNLDELEDNLIEAIEESGAGRWEGHGTDLKTGFFDIRFFGPQIGPMVEALRPVLKRAGARLPTGWYLTSRPSGGGKEKRITP